MDKVCPLRVGHGYTSVSESESEWWVLLIIHTLGILSVKHHGIFLYQGDVVLDADEEVHFSNAEFTFLILNPVTKMMSFQHICMLRMIYRVATNDR